MADEPAPEPQRAIIVIGNPGLSQGPLQTGCSTCNKKKPITVSTQLLIHQARKDGNPPIIVCHDCFRIARDNGLFLDNPAMGVRDGSRLMGYS